MDYKEAIECIKANYPPVNYTMLREALDMAIKLFEEKDKQESKCKLMGTDYCENECPLKKEISNHQDT